MLTKSHELDFPDSVAAGTAFRVAGMTNLTLQILDAGTGVTMTVQGSTQDADVQNLNPAVPPSGVVWSTVTTWVTADGLVLIDILPNLAWIRLNTTAYSSGTPRANLRYTCQ